MFGTFFVSWQLWEKLCFILGVAIVIVILLGIVKLTYNHWKLRKYTKIAATKAVLKNEMQHSQSVRRGRARDVPFGIRAIESGVEVDGVWISRPNTPASSIPGSPVLSATPARQVTGPQDVHLDRVSSASNTAYFETSNATQSRCQTDATPGPSVRTPINRPSRKHEPPPTSDHQARGRPTYQPRRASHLRYSNSHDPEDSESTIETDGRPASSDRNGKRPERYESEGENNRPSASLSGSSGNSGHGNLSRPRRSTTSSNDFLHPEYSNPQTGRIANRYELNDLSPQTMREGQGINAAGSSSSGAFLNDMSAYGFAGGHCVDEAILALRDPNDPFVTPTESLKDGYGPSHDKEDDVADQHTQLMKNNEITYDEGHAQPVRPSDGEGGSRRSEVIRKVNSSFQILRPGTLDTAAGNGNDIEPKDDPKSGDKRVSRKLQKRGRASSRSSCTLEI